LSNLGVALMRQGRIDDAISHLKNALRFNPDDERIRFNLDLALKQKYLRKVK
ncbi:MAG: tetratricopeptide repeat protein, partial [Desulfobacteraceae bacterium]|nr:tetratricopeptide repeat protein [Desulfobacteraceae bacterium]